MSSLSVLLIDNNRQRTQSLSMLLGFMGFGVSTQTQLETSESISIETGEIDLIIFGDKSLTAFLPVLLNLNQCYPQIPFLLLRNNDDLPLDAIQQQYPLCLGIFDEPFKQDTFVGLTQSLFSNDITSIAGDLANADSSNEEIETNNHVEQQSSKEAKPVENTQPLSYSNTYIEEHFVGQSEAILSVKNLIKQVSKTNANVLILGESGTGKEVVANCIHMLSKRKDHAYVPINCGAIPAELLESELFGHEKGAFTGAISARQGRFELAQSGTLFLDEIGDMPLTMQVKLLRVLQEKIFERVGGAKSIRADVRVLAATHRNLEGQVEDGKFREDLYYRLNVFPIEIPALRERVTDIPLLIQLFNQQVIEETGEGVVIADEAMASLFCHSWPGNVRELGNLVERLSIMYMGEQVQLDDLPDKYQYDISDFDFNLLVQPALEQIDIIEEDVTSKKPIDLSVSSMESEEKNTSVKELENPQSVNDEHEIDFTSINAIPDDGEFDLKEHLSHLEQNLIQDAIQKSDGVVAHAAKRLNIRRTTLVEKMRKYGI